MPAALNASAPFSPKSRNPELTREALGGEFLKVFLPALIFLLTEFAQILPDVEPGIMAIGEDDAHGVVSDGFDARNPDVLLAGDGDALVGAVALHLGARREHAQQLGGPRFGHLESILEG